MGFWTSTGVLFFGIVVTAIIAESRDGVNEGNVYRLMRSRGGANVASRIEFHHNGPNGQELRLSGLIGVSLPDAVGSPVAIDCSPNDPTSSCFTYGDFANVTISEISNSTCARVEWTSNQARRLEDCFDITANGIHMYGGSETLLQYWPINNDTKVESPYVTGDFLGAMPFGGKLENYWLFSTGASLHIDEDTPLFLSWDTRRPGQLCAVAADQDPYQTRDAVTLKYTVCVGENIKTVHQENFQRFYQLPTGMPDQNMLIRPLWSTWAQYKTEVNQSIVLQFTQDVVNYGFAQSSHIEIDDDWEPCYGDEEFDFEKFPDPAGMVSQIKSMGFNVTLWVHPFINYGQGCEMFRTALNGNYLIRDHKNMTGLATWWQGTAGVIDTNNPAAVTWWQQRLEGLRTRYGIDSFKFDAGEVNWLPYSKHMEGNQNLAPNLYTTNYVDAVSVFGGLVEVRSAHLNQQRPIFFRMMDKLSHWEYNAGLKSLIPTALFMGIAGYPFVLPDMIGGNAYDEGWPAKELYIRWMQANVFMPAVQFSIVPWTYDNETIQICQEVLEIREQHRDLILEAATQAVADGSPINRPLWWVDPTDSVTFTIDQEYMLGDSILVAPVVEEGATVRDIYLPRGSWRDARKNETYTGPLWLRNYPAPIDIVPYFLRTV